MLELMPRLPLNEIGGAKVFRACTIDGKQRLRGEILSPELVASIKSSNLRSLIDQRFIQPFRQADGVVAVAVSEPGEVMVVPRLGAPNRFDVVIGRRLNSGPLTKAEADALATRVKPTAAEAAA